LSLVTLNILHHSNWNNATRLFLPVRSSRGVLKDSLFHCSRNTKQKVQANPNCN
jgi:hypothetical protein